LFSKVLKHLTGTPNELLLQKTFPTNDSFKVKENPGVDRKSGTLFLLLFPCSVLPHRSILQKSCKVKMHSSHREKMKGSNKQSAKGICCDKEGECIFSKKHQNFDCTV
jgi:hypothetical protein